MAFERGLFRLSLSRRIVIAFVLMTALVAAVGFIHLFQATNVALVLDHTVG